MSLLLLHKYLSAKGDQLLLACGSCLPARFNGRLSPEHDAEQEAGNAGCSDLLSASQQRFASEDGRRWVSSLPCPLSELQKPGKGGPSKVT